MQMAVLRDDYEKANELLDGKIAQLRNLTLPDTRKNQKERFQTCPS